MSLSVSLSFLSNSSSLVQSGATLRSVTLISGEERHTPSSLISSTRKVGPLLPLHPHRAQSIKAAFITNAGETLLCIALARLYSPRRSRYTSSMRSVTGAPTATFSLPPALISFPPDTSPSSIAHRARHTKGVCDPSTRSTNADHSSTGRCWCDQKDNFDREGYSCLNRFDALFK